jgi:protein phosphatase
MQGAYRAINEDRVAVAEWPDAVVCVVADGGSGWDGEWDATAAERAVATLLANLDKLARDRAGEAGIDGALREAFARAHAAVRRPGYDGGSTATSLLWVRDTARIHVGHVGDTRAYCLTNQGLRALTVNHDVAEAMVSAGTVTRDQPEYTWWRNILHRYLGNGESAEGNLVDLASVPIQPGDQFLLCCDGVYNRLFEVDFVRVVGQSTDPRRRAEALCQCAVDCGSKDNVSCIVVDVEGD